MVAPNWTNLRMTRKQIEEVVGKSPRAVRQFERLFRGQNGASPLYGWRHVDADTGVEDDDYLFVVDSTGGNREIQLPPADAAEGRQLAFKLIDASGNGYTILPDGTETIDGASSLTRTAQWQSDTIISEGTQWLIL